MLAVLAGWGPLQVPGGFDRALELAGEGRLAEALEAADRETDALRRARARVYVLYRGRDYLGALAAAQAGLQFDARDGWLLERAAASALALQAADSAAGFVARLRATLDREDLSPAGRAERAERVARYAAAAAEQADVDRRCAAALRSARSTALGVIALGLAALLVLGRAE